MDKCVKYSQTLKNYNYLYTSNDIKPNSYYDNYNTCDDLIVELIIFMLLKNNQFQIYLAQ